MRESISGRIQGIRRALRRNRAGVIALIAVSALVGLLAGISQADSWWFQRAPGNQPPGRFGAATVFDGTNNEVLVFGGFGFVSDTNPTLVPLDDTRGHIGYGASQSKWTNRNPIHKPSPRGFAAMAYDAARNNTVLFGGNLTYGSATALSNETWTWDGRDWTLQNPPGNRPSPRRNHSMAYDAHRKVVVLFGGRSSTKTTLAPEGEALNDTWIWDGFTWKKMETPPALTSRHSAAMAYDLCRAETVLFGGSSGEGTATAGSQETWVWSGESWNRRAVLLDPNGTQRTDPTSPPPRFGASMIYSPFSGRVILYGGMPTEAPSGVAADDDIWRWDGTSWEKDASEGSSTVSVDFGEAGGGNSDAHPTPRAYAAFAYTPGGPAFALLFGGTPSGRAGVPRLTGGLFEAINNAVDLVPGSRGTQVPLQDQYHLMEIPATRYGAGNLLLGIRRQCLDPVPIPGDVLEAGEKAPEAEVRTGIQEFKRLPVLLGDDPREVPAGAPKPLCLRRNQESVSNTHLTTDPKRNRVYQFFVCQPPTDAERAQGRKDYVLAEAYHGSTLEPLGRALMPLRVGGLGMMHDPERARFLLLTSATQSGNTAFTLNLISQDLIEKGENPLTGKVTLPISQVQGISPVVFFNHPTTGRGKLLVGLSGSGVGGTPANTPPALAQLDLEEGREDWRRSLDGCLGSQGVYPGYSFRSGDRVYTNCSFSGRWAVVRFPIVEVPGDANPNDKEEAGALEVFLSQETYVDDAWGDPATERMLLSKYRSFNDPYDAIWVFDGRASRFVGRVGLASASASGFDEETGRLYLLAGDQIPQGSTTVVQGGLFVLDSRLTPTSQAVNFSQFAYPGGTKITTLPPTNGLPRRVFLRRFGGTMWKYPDGQRVEVPTEPYYLVLADELSVPEQPEISKLDRLTLPLPENPQKTDVAFDAEGSGYGIRLRSVGGVASVLRPFPQMGDGAQILPSLLLDSNRPLIAACLYPDRELVAGWVPQAVLSDIQTSARSSGLEVDSTSKVDLGGPSARCLPTGVSPNSAALPDSVRAVLSQLWPLIPFAQADQTAGSGITTQTGQEGQSTDTHTTPLGTLEINKDQTGKPTGAKASTTGTSWDNHFQEAACVGKGQSTHQVGQGAIFGFATCDQDQGRVGATARSRSTGTGQDQDTQAFSIAEGYSDVEVKRDPQKGVVVTSIAVAKGIQLGPFSIDRVETRAVAWSNGRPGGDDEPRATFTRDICGVHDPEGRIPNGCLTSAQQKQFMDEWNRRWGINGRMSLPTPDPDYLQGSAGGYTSGVLKRLAEQVENRLLINDSHNEVPGLVIEFYKDSAAGPGRQILELAAVRAVTSFGVQCQFHLLYSSSSNDCIAPAGDIFEQETFEEQDEEVFEEEGEEASEGYWIPAQATGNGESLGAKIGRFIDRLPVLRRLPIRQMAEALLAGSVWMLLGLPLLFAWRRLTLNLDLET